MALFNGFTFDGVNSLDYGIYITGEGVYNAPERAVEMVEIQGRNGALAIDQGRWDNIEVTYHCGCFGADQADFAERIGRFRNAICSRTSYCHLADDYHPDEYRLALCHAGVESDHVRRAGEFDIIFDCKPQRFLTSGEDTITVGDWGDVTEYSGDIVSLEGDEMTAVKSLSISLSPIQNLNGYDHPWVGGAGKNLLKPTQRTATANGVTYTVAADGKVTLTGTASGDTSFTLYTGQTLKDGGAYTCSLYGATNAKVNGGASHTRIVEAGTSPSSLAITITNGTVYNESFFVQIEKGTTATTYEPYENICPISGWDGVSVTRAGKNLARLANKSGQYNGLTIVSDGAGTVKLSGTKNTASWTQNAVGETFILPAGTYTMTLRLSGTITEQGVSLGIANHYETVTPTNTTVIQTFTYTKPTTLTYNIWTAAGVYDAILTTQIERGAESTDFEPYQGTTYTQEFEDSQGNTLTVYGGEDEIVGGVLTVTHKLVDMGDLTFSKNTALSGFDRFAVTLSDMKPTANSTAMLSAISSAYEGKKLADANNTPRAGLMAGLSTVVYFYELPNAFTAAEFKTARSGQTLCYELATPITYTLAPQQVETLIGTNNIWSDAGEVTVEIADDPNKIVNPTLYDAKPLIKVSGYGTVQVGSVTITIEGSASDVTYIDCDSMECYRLNGLSIVSANSAVSFSSYDFPVLEADSITGVTYSTNVSQVQIVPRWWQL